MTSPVTLGRLLPARSDSGLSAAAQLHAAFCRTGLPVRGQRTAWTRTIVGATVAFEPTRDDVPIPSGPLLRLLLLHLCTSAAASTAPVVELGASAEDLAEQLGIPEKAATLAEQIERLVATRMTISAPGGGTISLLDTRGRPRTQRAGWLSSLRLTSRFADSLRVNVVPLDGALAHHLAASPATFDAYAAVRAAIAPLEMQGLTSMPWEDFSRAAGLGAGGLPAFLRALEANVSILRNAGIEPHLRWDDEAIHISGAAHSEAVGAPSAEPPVELVEPPSSAPEPDAAPPVQTPAASAEAETPMPAPQAGRTQPEPPQPNAEPASAVPQASGDLEPPEPPDAALSETISLGRDLTGLPWVVWLRRGYGADAPLIGLTPTDRFDRKNLALLMIEPVIMPLEGSIDAQGVDQAASWITANRDLIDDVWSGSVASFKEVRRRLKKASSASSRAW